MDAKKSGCNLQISSLIASLESAPVGDGDLLGSPFQCLPYQRRFIRGAFRPRVLRAGLSLARGGGKTGLASALALDSIRPAGVLHRDGGETIVIASAFAQARLTFEAVRTSLELLGEDGAYRIRDQQNLADIQHRRTKARLRVAGADNRRAHGWRANLIIGDEPSQSGPRGELLAAAIRTALGKRSRSAGDLHWHAAGIRFALLRAAARRRRPECLRAGSRREAGRCALHHEGTPESESGARPRAAGDRDAASRDAACEARPCRAGDMAQLCG